MSGYLYAFGAALFTAISDAMAKMVLRRHSPVVVAWARFAISAIFLLPLLAFISIPPLDRMFWVCIAILMPLEVVAIILYMKALQISPLSLTVPFLSLTPVFTILTSFLVLGEIPDPGGIAGVCCIVAGAFFLNMHQLKAGMFQPFRSILSEKGSILMIIVAFIYSVTSVVGKAAIVYSSPAFMGVVYMPLISLFILPLALRSGMHLNRLRSGWIWFLLIGACQALMALCHFKGISMILVSYMISVKRLSLLMGVLFGGVLFHETHIRERLAGSLLMFLGVLLIVL